VKKKKVLPAQETIENNDTREPTSEGFNFFLTVPLKILKEWERLSDDEYTVLMVCIASFLGEVGRTVEILAETNISELSNTTKDVVEMLENFQKTQKSLLGSVPTSKMRH
jgi:hypothetical protein